MLAWGRGRRFQQFVWLLFLGQTGPGQLKTPQRCQFPNIPSEPLLGGNRAGHADAEAYCVLLEPCFTPVDVPLQLRWSDRGDRARLECHGPSAGGAMGSRFSAVCCESRTLLRSQLDGYTIRGRARQAVADRRSCQTTIREKQ